MAVTRPVPSATVPPIANAEGGVSLPWATGGGGVVPPIPGPDEHRLALSAGNAGAAGDGGYAEVPTAAALEPTANFTFVCRAYSFDPSGYTGAGATFWSQWDVAAAKCRLTCYRNTTNDTQIVVGHSNTGADTISCSVFTNVSVWTENAEHELAFCYDGAGATNADKAKLYLDGALPTQNYFGTWPAALTAPGAPMNFGHRKGSAAHRPFCGYLWDVRVYNVTLSAAQVAAAYADPDDATLPAPVARWKFPETSGTFTSSPGSYVATPTAVADGRAPTRVIQGAWLGAGAGSSAAVMCIGDSFTRGFLALDRNGFRSELRQRLYSVHKKRHDLVGPFDGDAASPTGFLDIEHAGIDGRKIDALIGSADMVGDAPGWIATYRPRAVVLWGGYNDVASLECVLGSQVRDRMETLARACNTASPGIKIVICTVPIPTSGVFGPILDAYNALLPALVTTLQGDSIAASLADVRAATSLTDVQSTDNIHLHRIGYERAAVVIADALALVL